jgi:hypothetical protein
MSYKRRIIIVDDASSPPVPMRTWAAFSVLCFIFSIGTFYGLSLLKVSGIATDGLSAMYAAIQPVFGPLFRLLKLEPLAAHASMSLVIYTILQIIGFRFLVPALQQKMQQLAALERALGPVTRPVHRLWFTVALITAGSAYALTTLPSWAGTSGTETVLMNLLRIGLFFGCATTACGTALIGYRLRRSWQRFKEFGAGLRHKPSPQDMAPSSGSTSDAPLEPGLQIEKSGLSDANADESVFIALAAELVETAGRSRALPHYRQLEMPLLELQQAAAATHTGQFEYADLRGLCQQACDLMASGKLSALPDLKAARSAYERRDPSLYVDLAAELRQKIKG